jgi:MFS family permease
VYAVLFAETGLSAAEISSLFVIWSVTAVVLEIPTGLWADLFSRRLLLVLAPLLTGAGYALWTFWPGYLSFAAGFVLWGTGSALASGSYQALAYEELERLGAADSYARVIGRSQAFGGTAQLMSNALAVPVLAAGGYLALGVASVAACLLGALAGWALPESRAAADTEQEASFATTLREGLAEVRHVPRIRRRVLFLLALTGVSALDEYIPLLADATDVAAPAVPLLVMVVVVGTALGGWLAGRGTHLMAPALAVAAVCLAAGAAGGSPAGFVPVAVAFGIFQWAIAAADARLQESLADSSRATVTSMSGVGSEVIAVLIYVAYGLSSTWAEPSLIIAVAALPYLVLALAVRRRG